MRKDEFIRELEALVLRANMPADEEVRLAIGCLLAINGCLFAGNIANLKRHIDEFTEEALERMRAHLRTDRFQ